MPASLSSYALGHFLLRAGIALAFLYPPLAALQDPIAWSGYFPDFIESLPIDTFLLLHAFGAIEIVLGLWILSGRSIRFPSLIAAFFLLAIVALNLNDFAILFRDVSLALAVLSLAFLPTPAHRIVL